MTQQMLTSTYFRNQPNLRHGFFTRRGGVSKGIYASLNCGPGSQDSIDAVTENRHRACKSLTLSHENLVTLRQVHSAKSIIITEALSNIKKTPQADALVTRTPGLILGILTADCAPILFGDVMHGVIGAAHAGWKGALDGVIEGTVSAMLKIGANKKNIVASIGPCIAQPSYQVGADFYTLFVRSDPEASGFFQREPCSDKHIFDLGGYIRARLIKVGIARVETFRNDTYEEEELFFSYRRNTHRKLSDYGRMISAIAIAE
ncbi:MAG: peptidoglycan editing factor PgeF [Pseudomonadota bacterium]|nr:peptidoglycan editing factor PgeF [Pseudomonadota bacterium]